LLTSFGCSSCRTSFALRLNPTEGSFHPGRARWGVGRNGRRGLGKDFRCQGYAVHRDAESLHRLSKSGWGARTAISDNYLWSPTPQCAEECHGIRRGLRRRTGRGRRIVPDQGRHLCGLLYQAATALSGSYVPVHPSVLVTAPNSGHSAQAAALVVQSRSAVPFDASARLSRAARGRRSTVRDLGRRRLAGAVLVRPRVAYQDPEPPAGHGLDVAQGERHEFGAAQRGAEADPARRGHARRAGCRGQGGRRADREPTASSALAQRTNRILRRDRRRWAR
jgi:hypothetical protein